MKETKGTPAVRPDLERELGDYQVRRIVDIRNRLHGQALRASSERERLIILEAAAAIRSGLEVQGIQLVDGPTGASWEREKKSSPAVG